MKITTKEEIGIGVVSVFSAGVFTGLIKSIANNDWGAVFLFLLFIIGFVVYSNYKEYKKDKKKTKDLANNIMQSVRDKLCDNSDE